MTLGYDVLATGHNLDDEAAVLFGNTLQWSGDFLLRQGPVLPEMPGMARKAKPLCRLYEREMTSYAILRGIEYIYEECPLPKARPRSTIKNCSTSWRTTAQAPS